MPDKKELVLQRLKNAINCREIIMEYRFYYEVVAILEEQEKRIKQLEYDLAVAQYNLNYYVNGNN